MCYNDFNLINIVREHIMANGNLTPEETIKVSRSSIKQLIKKYNASNGLDKTTLQLIIEQLAKTPLFFAVQKGTADKKADEMSFLTLATGGQVFIPIFTGEDELGKLADNADIVVLYPQDYFEMLVSGNRHAVINPFSSYFLLWPELVRDHLIPFVQEKDGVIQQI